MTTKHWLISRRTALSARTRRVTHPVEDGGRKVVGNRPSIASGTGRLDLSPGERL